MEDDSMTEYIIEHTQPTVYTDNKGSAVTGFEVQVTFPEFDETHTLRVPKLDPATVKAAVEELLTQRRALASLGG
jgi:hypothetical protein